MKWHIKGKKIALLSSLMVTMFALSGCGTGGSCCAPQVIPPVPVCETKHHCGKQCTKHHRHQCDKQCKKHKKHHCDRHCKKHNHCEKNGEKCGKKHHHSVTGKKDHMGNKSSPDKAKDNTTGTGAETDSTSTNDGNTTTNAY